MDGVGTPIIGRPRPLPGHDTPNPAHNTYTLKCEEPFYEEHNDRLEEARRGMRTDDLIYPQMKLLDMGFWQIGFERDAGDAK